VNDTRLNQVLALLDDARCILADIHDEGMSEQNANRLDAAAGFISSAVPYIRKVMR
jgi:hypothetical protein